MSIWTKERAELVLGTAVELKLISSRVPFVHVCVVRDIQRGRTVRRAGERLCTKGTVRAYALPDQEAVTCMACIRRLVATAEQREVLGKPFAGGAR